MKRPARGAKARPSGPAEAGPRDPHPGWLPAAVVFGWAGFLLLTASLTIFKMSNNDIWIHLKTGQIILETWQVPDKDPYSFTAPDHDYVAHEWLSGVLFHLVHAAAGVHGLIFFKSFVILLTCLALQRVLRILEVPLSIAFACMTLMLFIGSARFLERPHIFSYLFIALYLLCYFSWRERGRRRVWLYAIPALHAVWTNLHGGHYQGIFLLIMLGAAEAVHLARARYLGLATSDASAPREVGLICSLPALSLLAGLLNPYGLRLLTFPFELTGQDVFMKGIYEWQPAIYPTYNLSSMFLYYIFWTSTLFGSFLLVRGHQELKGLWRDAAWTGNVLLAALWLLFTAQFAAVYKTSFSEIPTDFERYAAYWYAAVALFLLANLHRLEFHHAGIVALFFAMSMRHNRAVTDAAIATTATLGHNLAWIGSRARSWIRPPRWLEPAALTLIAWAMFSLATFTWTHSYHFSFSPPTRREMGLGIAGNMPVGAVDYIARNRIGGRAFPSYNSAAILLHRMWPAVKVAMDSRNDVYGESLYREYTAALAGGEALASYIRKWDIEFFLITYGTDRDPDFFRYLDDSPEWALVYFDDRAVVYVRDIPRFHDLISRDRYVRIQPARAGPVEILQAEAADWLSEADRAAAAAPGAWSPLQYKTKALFALNRFDAAEGAARRVIELNPDAFFAWSDLGFIYLYKGDRTRAAEAFAECLRLRPGYGPCRDNLMRLQGAAP
ncbi:MAG TPA: hypothetical protein VFP98_05365 [Candidatus Polarisedimenticolia bacterium]|nr:hypothetical protein [Candidatus Polarisedimenticolia bacterium]